MYNYKSCSKLPSDTIYNIYRDKDTKLIKVTCLGMDCIDNPLNSSYIDWSDLPQWVQKKIAVLKLLSVAFPTEEVKGVGQRGQDEESFWVYA